MVVITGSESFIGKQLKLSLKKKTIPFQSIDTIHSADPAHTVADICSKDIARAIPENADTLIHLAAISRDQDCKKDPQLAFKVNVNGTLNIAQAAQIRKVKQFIFASSEWVYGEVSKKERQTEDDSIDISKVKSEYAITKLVGEQLLKLFHDQSACAVTILRFAIVYGPRKTNWSAVEQLFDQVRNQNTIEVGSLATARRFIHVKDICEGIIASLGRRGFDRFNLSGDRLISLGEVISESASVWKREPKIIEKNPASCSIRDPDNAKARLILGWCPKIRLREGIESLKAEGGLP